MEDEHAQIVQCYIDALEVEKLKIQVFQRELPLCLDLVSKAIENYRQQLSGVTTTDCLHSCGLSECSEQTSTQGPVLEEFIPIKKPCSGSDDDDHAELYSGRDVKGTPSSNDNKTKSDWLRSAQLWNQTTPDPPPKDDASPKRVPLLGVERKGGAFQPFNREQGTTAKNGHTNKQSLLALDKLHSHIPAAATSSTAETIVGSGRKEEKEPTQPNRKQRRNWSPELHRRFLQALQQLGGSHASTPKQIRELMKVDGLTNDEVKSHLQKYRLHTRRPTPPSVATIPAAGAQTPQFVVVGGIWVPPAAAVTGPAPSASAQPPANSNQKKSPDDSEGRGSRSAGGEEEAHGTRSRSPTTSSSSHTTTESCRH